MTGGPREVATGRPYPIRARRLFPTGQIELLLILGCFVPFTVIAHPKTPVFGGTKYWNPSARPRSPKVPLLPLGPQSALLAALPSHLHACSGPSRYFP